MELHGRLGSPEAGPREQRETEIEGRRTERVGGLRHVDCEGLLAIQYARPMEFRLNGPPTFLPV